MRIVKYEHMRKSKSVMTFIDELPHKIRLELAMEIHKKMYETINFFKQKEQTFIVWIGTLLRPLKVEEHEYIYKETEEITESKLVHSLLHSFLPGGGHGGLRAAEVQ